jgi:hypothetical protein
MQGIARDLDTRTTYAWSPGITRNLDKKTTYALIPMKSHIISRLNKKKHSTPMQVSHKKHEQVDLDTRTHALIPRKSQTMSSLI